MTEAQVEESPALEPNALIAQGVRSLALKKYDAACEALSRAVELLSEKYGEMAIETVDPLTLYGKALLFNAIANSAVLGNNAPDADAVPDQASSSSAVASSSTSAPQPVTAQFIQFHFGGDEPDGDSDSEDGDGEEREEGGGDREDDLENAFLVLDTARAILEKKAGEVEFDQKRADVHRLLGDVATESEQFDSAFNEYSAAISILTPILPPSDRILSELHMLIALALDFVPGRSAEAVKHAERAKDVLLLRIEALEEVLAGDEEDSEGAKTKAKKEIDDINSLMGDVDYKIEDLKIALTLPVEATNAALEDFMRPIISNSVPSGPVNDLSSLVKKKKKSAVVEPAPVVEEDKSTKRKAEVLDEEKKPEEVLETAGKVGEAKEVEKDAKKPKLEEGEKAVVEAS